MALFWTVSNVLLFVTAAAYKLNVPKVLLPYRFAQSSPPVNFTLEITDIDDTSSACFQWRSSRPEVAEVYPWDGDQRYNGRCSLRALVSAVSQQSFRRTAIVSAEDVHSGTILRCDVIVDELSSLEILTTTRQLYLEDSPELFIVRAKNSEGDTFADLDGLIFDWKVESATGASDLHAERTSPARIVSFADSEYETTSAIRKLEADGLRGDRILVEGRSTGVASISVQSLGEPYKTRIAPSSIQLTVMAFLALEPSADLRVPIGSQIRYSLQLIRHKKADTIPLPSALYRINLETIETKQGTEVAIFRDTTSTLEALALGTVLLSVEDRKLDVTVAKHDLPSVYVYVVHPSEITFAVSTGIWVFEVGRSYDVNINLVDSQGRNLFITDNTILDTTFPTDLLRPKQVTARNGTVWTVKALKEGAGVIEANHDSYLDTDGEPVPVEHTVHGSRSFEVYSPISIFPPLLVFPPCDKSLMLAAAYEPCFTKRLVANGGSGHFVWMLDTGTFSSPNAAKVLLQTVGDQTVNVSTLEGGPITALAVAADTKNRLHRAHAKVIVTEPLKAEFVDAPREVEIGATLYLHLRVYGGVRMSDEKHVPFTDCSSMAFDVRVSNEAVLSRVPQTGNAEPGSVEETPGCVVVQFLARAVGDATVSVNVHSLGAADRDSLTATAGISVYAPLKLVSPPTAQLILTPTSTYNVVFTGGPKPLFLEPASHIVAVEGIGKTSADYFETSSVTETSASEGDAKKSYTFLVTCLSGTPAPSEASLLISVGNRKTMTNPFPALSSISMQIICDFPSSISLQLKPKKISHDDKIDSPPCPLDGLASSAAVPVYKGAKFDLLASLFNHAGMKFHNASALELLWLVSDTSMLRSPAAKAHSLQWRGSTEPSGVFEFYETFQPTGQEGIAKVTAEVTGLAKEACSHSRKQCDEFLRRSLKALLFLKLSSYATVIPADVFLYNDPRSRAVLSIQGGSGHYHLLAEKKETGIISWIIQDGGRSLQVQPIGGRLGQCALKIHDVCLPEALATTTNVVVTSMEKLVLSGPSFVMLGEALKLRVNAFDGLDRHLLADEIFDFLPLDVKVDGVGLVLRQYKKEMAIGKLSFEASGVGEASVAVTVVDPNNGHVITSAPHRVHIFPAFQLEPQIIALVAGARFQIRISGGLQYSSSWFVDPASSGVTFSINDTKVAAVGADGMVEAKRPGHAAITARLANPEKPTDVLAEATAVIRVVRLAAVKIHTPASTVYVGSVIPLSFIGQGDDHASYTDLASTNAVFPWGTAGASLPSSWSVEGDGVELDPGHVNSVAGTVRLRCMQPGVFRVRLSVEQPNMELAKLQFSTGAIVPRSGGGLNASLIITVIKELRFDDSIAWRHSGGLPPRLLIDLNTTFPLQFSEQLSKPEYGIYDADQSLVKIDSDGVLESSASIGDTVVSVIGKRKSMSNVDEIAALSVSIRSVSYFLMSDQRGSLSKEYGWSNDQFPVHYTLKFHIQYFDHQGSRFDAVNRARKIAVRPNRFDLVDVSVKAEGENENLVVRLKAVGDTVIKVWDEEKPDTLSEYIHIHAIRSIQPFSPTLQIGQKSCFSNDLPSPDTDYSWSSSDPNVVSIDPALGIAIARSPGQSTIFHSPRRDDAEDFTTWTVVTVAEPMSIFLALAKGPSFFVDADMEDHAFLVSYQSDDGKKRSECTVREDTSIPNQAVDHTCGVQILPPLPHSANAALFYAEAAYAPSIGLACVVRRRQGAAMGTTVQMDTDRNVSVWASRGPLMTNVLTYPLYPPIVVQPTELLLDNDRSPKSIVTVSAWSQERLNGVKVRLSPDARELFMVKAVAKSDGKTVHQVESMLRKEFIVKLLPATVVDLVTIGRRGTDFHILVTDGLTDISYQISIRFTLHVKAPKIEDETSRGLLGLLWDLLVGTKDVYGIVVVIVVSAALTIVSVHFGYRFVLAATTRASDSVTAPFTPVSPASIPWRSYAAQGVRSPQLWSLDRSQSPPSSSIAQRQLTPESVLTMRKNIQPFT